MAKAFLEAVQTQDREAVAGLLSDPALTALDEGSSFQLTGRDFEKPEVGDVTVTGNDARVQASILTHGSRQELGILLRRSVKGWRVRGVAMVLGEGEITFDFEAANPLIEAMAESIGEEISAAWEKSQQEQIQRELVRRREAFLALRSQTVADFERSFQVTTDLRGMSVSKALAALAHQMDLELHAGEVVAPLASKVETDVRGQSCLEAFERICQGAGVHPVFPRVAELLHGPSGDAGRPDDPSTRAIQVQAGTRELPVTFTGPFAVAIQGVEQHVPYARGTVQIDTQAHGLDPSVLALLQPLGETIVVQRAVDANGNSLLAREDVRFHGGGVMAGSSFEDSTRLDLKGLLRSVPQITKIEGVRRVLLPLTVEEVRFDKVEKGAKITAGGIELVVEQVGNSLAIDGAGSGERLETVKIMGRALDADGNDLQVHYEDTMKWSPDRVRYQLQAVAPPHSLELKIVTASRVLEYPFTLANVPLSRHDEMPDAVEALAFGGRPAPVSVTFDRFHEPANQFPEAGLQLQNHSNKDVLSLQVEFHYLDGAGKLIEAFPHTVTGPPSFDGPQPLVRAGAEAEVKTTAFFRPDTARGLRVTIDHVEFMDAAVWSTEQ